MWIIIGDSMLTNINSRGLSKFKKVTVIKNPGRKSDVMEKEIEQLLKKIPIFTHSLFTPELMTWQRTSIHWDLWKKYAKRQKNSPYTKIAFSNVIFRKDSLSTKHWKIGAARPTLGSTVFVNRKIYPLYILYIL